MQSDVSAVSYYLPTSRRLFRLFHFYRQVHACLDENDWILDSGCLMLDAGFSPQFYPPDLPNYPIIPTAPPSSRPNHPVIPTEPPRHPDRTTPSSRPKWRDPAANPDHVNARSRCLDLARHDKAALSQAKAFSIRNSQF